MTAFPVHSTKLGPSSPAGTRTDASTSMDPPLTTSLPHLENVVDVPIESLENDTRRKSKASATRLEAADGYIAEKTYMLLNSARWIYEKLFGPFPFPPASRPSSSRPQGQRTGSSEGDQPTGSNRRFVRREAATSASDGSGKMNPTPLNPPSTANDASSKTSSGEGGGADLRHPLSPSTATPSTTILSTASPSAEAATESEELDTWRGGIIPAKTPEHIEDKMSAAEKIKNTLVSGAEKFKDDAEAVQTTISETFPDVMDELRKLKHPPPRALGLDDLAPHGTLHHE